MAPQAIETLLERNGLTVYSSKVTAAKVGPKLTLCANYSHAREDWEPLSKEESIELIARVTRSLEKRNYKIKMAVSQRLGTVNINDFKIEILLLPTDISEERYILIQAAQKFMKQPPKRPMTLRESFGE